MSLLLCLFAPLASQATQLAREPGPFTDFAGSYRGTSRLVSVYPGKSHMNFAVPPNGNSGVLTVKGTATGGGMTYDVGNVLRFTSRTFSASRLAPGIVDFPQPRGRLSASRKVLRGSCQINSDLRLTVKATLKKSRKLAGLAVEYKIYNTGILVYQLDYRGTRKIKPE